MADIEHKKFIFGNSLRNCPIITLTDKEMRKGEKRTAPRLMSGTKTFLNAEFGGGWWIPMQFTEPPGSKWKIVDRFNGAPS